MSLLNGMTGMRMTRNIRGMNGITGITRMNGITLRMTKSISHYGTITGTNGTTATTSGTTKNNTTTKNTTPGETNLMTFKDYFKSRKLQKRVENVLGFSTLFLSLQSSAYYFLFVAKIDPTQNIMGMVRRVMLCNSYYFSLRTHRLTMSLGITSILRIQQWLTWAQLHYVVSLDTLLEIC